MLVIEMLRLQNLFVPKRFFRSHDMVES